MFSLVLWFRMTRRRVSAVLTVTYPNRAQGRYMPTLTLCAIHLRHGALCHDWQDKITG